METFLLDKFNPKYIVIGYDHRFGLNRQGDINYLKWYAKKSKFEVVEISRQDIDDITISSTKVREALIKGEIRKATDLLNHYYLVSGIVVQGKGIGKNIGFPTANIEIKNKYKLIPPPGIYAVRIFHNEQAHHGMLYIGDRPTLCLLYTSDAADE